MNAAEYEKLGDQICELAYTQQGLFLNIDLARLANKELNIELQTASKTKAKLIKQRVARNKRLIRLNEVKMKKCQNEIERLEDIIDKSGFNQV